MVKALFVFYVEGVIIVEQKYEIKGITSEKEREYSKTWIKNNSVVLGSCDIMVMRRKPGLNTIRVPMKLDISFPFSYAYLDLDTGSLLDAGNIENFSYEIINLFEELSDMGVVNFRKMVFQAVELSIFKSSDMLSQLEQLVLSGDCSRMKKILSKMTTIEGAFALEDLKRRILENYKILEREFSISNLNGETYLKFLFDLSRVTDNDYLLIYMKKASKLYSQYSDRYELEGKIREVLKQYSFFREFYEEYLYEGERAVLERRRDLKRIGERLLK